MNSDAWRFYLLPSNEIQCHPVPWWLPNGMHITCWYCFHLHEDFVPHFHNKSDGVLNLTSITWTVMEPCFRWINKKNKPQLKRDEESVYLQSVTLQSVTLRQKRKTSVCCCHKGVCSCVCVKCFNLRVGGARGGFSWVIECLIPSKASLCRPLPP